MPDRSTTKTITYRVLMRPVRRRRPIAERTGTRASCRVVRHWWQPL